VVTLNMKKTGLKSEWRNLPGMDDILDAYDNNDLEELKNLIESSDNKKEILEFVYLNAVKDGWTECVRYCLSAGVDPAAHWGDALILSARNGHVDIFKLINDTVNVYDVFNNRQIRLAIVYASLYSPEILDVMIRDYPDVYNDEIPGIIEYLLDVRMYDAAVRLYEKAKSNGIEINEEVENILKSELSRIDTTTPEKPRGYSDRYLGGGGGYAKPDYLLEDWTFPEYNEDVNNLLVSGAMYGRIGDVRRALMKGADIHAGNDAALVAAVFNCHPDVVELLLENGADPFARNGALFRIARSSGCPEVARILDRYAH